MERIKVDLLITGDLQCKQKLMGGVISTSSAKKGNG